MKRSLKKIFVIPTLLLIILLVSGCGPRMTQEEVEEIKIQQTIGRYMDGFAQKNTAQIIQTLNMEERQRKEIEAVLDQFLQTLHRDPFAVKVSYNIHETIITNNTAEINLSAMMRIMENNNDLLSIRLFQDRNLMLYKDSSGEWKIDYRQFIPEELLKFEFLFSLLNR